MNLNYDKKNQNKNVFFVIAVDLKGPGHDFRGKF